MGPFPPLQLAQRYVAPHRVHYRSLSLTIAHHRSAAQRSRSGNAPLLLVWPILHVVGEEEHR